MDPIEYIFDLFGARGGEIYASEAVSQEQHALQSAALARDAGSTPELVVAALLHDLGHIMSNASLPDSDEENLHDQHEEKAYGFLLSHFGPAVAEPARLHVAAKRYLCTTDPAYFETLSPTSQKSFLDQGGAMSAAELEDFRAHPFSSVAIKLRHWDDQAKDPAMVTPTLYELRPLLSQCLLG